MTPNWTWVKSTLYTPYTYLRGPNFRPFRSMTSRFLDTCTRTPEIHGITPNWTWTLNSQKYSTYTKYLPLRPIFFFFFFFFGRFALRLAVSDIQGWRNRKWTEWPQTDLEDLTVKSTLYTLNTYPWGPNFRQFRSSTSRFGDARSSKIGNAPNEPKLSLNT